MTLAACPVTGAPGTAHGSPRLLGDDPESHSGAGGAFQRYRSYAEAGAHPRAVPYIRRHTRQTLAAWRLGHVADDIELVVSELVTNAVTATSGMQAAAPVALYLALERCGLFALVWDASLDLPGRRDHASDAESGRGLELVQALSADWGACAQPDGKITWARFDLEAPI